MTSYTPVARGSYKHQGDWITAICAASDHLVSASRDKTLCLWNIRNRSDDEYIHATTLLTGHNHIVQDLVLSSDGQYAISASWDRTLRLWDLNKKKTMQTFVGHTGDVLSVSISKGNRQIISAGRDKTIKLWNIHGECKHTTPELSEWITCAKFGLTDDTSPIVSAGYDRQVCIWDRATFTRKYAFAGHTGYINTVAISADSTLVASGGQDETVNMWDLQSGKHLYPLKAGAVVNHIEFSPNRFWIAVSTDNGLKIFDLNKRACLADLKLQESELVSTKSADEEEMPAAKTPKCLSCAFSVDGMHIFGGFSDHKIRCWNLPAQAN